MLVAKTRCGGDWTEGRFNSFIKSGLRRLSMKWKPKNVAKLSVRLPEKYKNERGRWVYHGTCEVCHKVFPETMMEVDHIDPVVPLIGWDSWDGVIERMFCERDGLQVVCKPCHTSITNNEKEQRKLWKHSTK